MRHARRLVQRPNASHKAFLTMFRAWTWAWAEGQESRLEIASAFKNTVSPPALCHTFHISFAPHLTQATIALERVCDIVDDNAKQLAGVFTTYAQNKAWSSTTTFRPFYKMCLNAGVPPPCKPPPGALSAARYRPSHKHSTLDPRSQ